MDFEVKLDDGQRLKISKMIMSGKVRVFLNNMPIGQLAWRPVKPIEITMKDGSKRSLTFKNGYFDPAPQVWLDGKEILLAEKLNNWQKVAVLSPLAIMVICGFGAIPGMVSALLAYLNFWIIRQAAWPISIRWTAVALVPIVGCVTLIAVLLLVFGPPKQATNTPPATRGYGPEQSRPAAGPSWTKDSKPAGQVETDLINNR